mmetsp:Transcript_8417/g.19315  ORF Transcript_8417/g.19315 Transcript_8417/m.19315 type:complete len:349 (+) Transcript_8417:27-1073(+)
MAAISLSSTLLRYTTKWVLYPQIGTGESFIRAPQWTKSATAPRVPRRTIAGTAGTPTPTDLHALYEEQMNEIQSEREAVFGPDDGGSSTQSLAETARPYLNHPESDKSADRQEDSRSAPLFTPPTATYSQEDEKIEREARFGFTEDEREAWSNANANHTPRSTQALNERIKHQLMGPNRISASPSDDEPGPFSHLNAQGDGVSMVDVGNKAVTRRTAVARTRVTFPKEVMSAFQISQSELIGPKGPIFETAKIAGIMGAKRTSDLIPLCHPLPLDRVNIDIRLEGNAAIVECECRVTHKTGVEMEALTGASVAALTIYDMVKAVSHECMIEETVLVSKSGGKSDFVEK